MSASTLWFERKFDAAVPVELLPNVLVRLRGTPARLEEILRGCDRGVLVRKAGGKWSAQEHAGHLLDLEPLWLARVEDYAASSERLTAADLTNRKTDEARHNEREIGEILSGFRAARGLLVARVGELEGSALGRRIAHPRLGLPMGLVDHLHFVAEHDDHHLARIWDLLGG